MGTSQMHLLIATIHVLPVSRCPMLTPMAPLVRATEEASETRTGLAVGDAARPDALLHAARGHSGTQVLESADFGWRLFLLHIHFQRLH